MRKPRVEPPEREMTKRDWLALSLTMKVSEQVVLYGEQALWDFVDAIAAARAPDRAPGDANG